MTVMNEYQRDNLRLMVLAPGLVLVAVAAFLLLFLSYQIYGILTRPADIPVVQFILEYVRIESPAITGQIRQADGYPADFEVRLSESVRMMFFIGIGIFILAIVGSVLKMVLEGGLKMVAFGIGAGEHRPGKEPHAAPNEKPGRLIRVSGSRDDIIDENNRKSF